MRLLLVTLTLLAFGSQISAQESNTTAETQKHQQYASITCFGKGQEISGMNKICYYDCLGSTAAITISAVELCPLTIQR
jgi:hypothetical protein